MIIFSKETSLNCTDDDFFNEAFLRAQEAYFNNILAAKRYVFESEVRRDLGLKLTSFSIIKGWLYEPAAKINFGIRKLSDNVWGLTIDDTSEVIWHKIDELTA